MRAVLGRELVPPAAAERLLERAQLLVGDAHGDDLAALEADAHVVEGRHQRAPRRRSRSRASRVGGAGSTISTSTRSVAPGLMNATREPRMPARGCSSMSARPASRTDASAASMSCHLVGDVVKARAALGEELAHRPCPSPSGASSSTWFSPTSSSAASTPCSATTSRWLSSSPSRRARARSTRRGPRRRCRRGRCGQTRPATLSEHPQREVAEELGREREVAHVDALVGAVHERRGLEQRLVRAAGRSRRRRTRGRRRGSAASR